MHLDSLPERTSRLLEKIAKVEEIAPDLLVGGTALALHDAHRQSEDLDFVQFGGSLDRPRIERILVALQPRSKPFLVTNQLAAQIAADEGFDLEDVHQDWDVDGVKLTFFCPWKADELKVLTAASPTPFGNVRVADPETVFALKSMVLAERTTSRDLFDLWHFVARRGKSIADIDAIIHSKLPLYGLDARLRLVGGKPFRSGDPGFLTSDDAAPKDPAELLQRMTEMVRDHRRELSFRIASLSKGPNRFPSGPAEDERQR